MNLSHLLSRRENLSRYWHTLRYLRPVQFYGRAWFRLKRPKPDMRPAPRARSGSSNWKPCCAPSSSLNGPASFTFLNKTEQIETAEDWNKPGIDKLWLYNLHYFDDLNAIGSENRTAWHRALIARWIDENPPGHGNGWEPYPLSLRIVNWIKWLLSENEPVRNQLHSLAIQARFLQARLEWHLLGNHLFANAKALIFAGLFFEGKEADEWRKTGLAILEKELKEQILADGGHFERSPMYHAILLADLLDLVNLEQNYPGMIPETTSRQWRTTTDKMRSWLAAMIHPDGEISFFNDAAMGIAPCYDELEAYSNRLQRPSGRQIRQNLTHLAASGYIRLQQKNMTAILDVAKIGPDYLPGHAHADTLSCEISLFGKRVIVNSGTSVYGNSSERLRQRSTGAHSTLELDGADSSEVWGGFRVARRARPIGLTIEQKEKYTRVSCGHDGYRRLTGRNLHTRIWCFEENGISITDRIKGPFRKATIRYYLHPDVNATVEKCGTAGRLILPDGQVVDWQSQGASVSIVPASWHPRFGTSITSHCLLTQTENTEFIMRLFYTVC